MVISELLINGLFSNALVYMCMVVHYKYSFLTPKCDYNGIILLVRLSISKIYIIGYHLMKGNR